MEIKTGLTGTASKYVTDPDTSVNVKSGTLKVLATPVLAALMEEAAVNALAEYLPKEKTISQCTIMPPLCPATESKQKQKSPVWKTKKSPSESLPMMTKDPSEKPTIYGSSSMRRNSWTV